MSHLKISSIDYATYTRKLFEIVQLSANEEQFKIGSEDILKTLCDLGEIQWNPYSYELSFKAGSRRLDAVHGTTIIEYEPPKSFACSENAQLRHARLQAEEYASLLSEEEGRAISAYCLVAWDGESITFGHSNGENFIWEPVRKFNEACLQRLIAMIAEGGRPLVTPIVLKQFVGTETEVGQLLIPKLFDAICNARQESRTHLIFTEWSRLFDQVEGITTNRLDVYFKDISHIHRKDYTENPKAYFFALNTYIAIVAKVCAVYALASQASEVLNPVANPITFLKSIEEGEYFRMFGIENMLGTDFFSWYLGSDVTVDLTQSVAVLLEKLRLIDFDTTRKNPKSVRDLFKGLYMSFTPASVRLALGEYYTPDWLASHVMDEACWKPQQSLLDPTCGSGTFILEALKRRLEIAPADTNADELLKGIYGFDLNPLAVLTAKASVVVFISDRFSPQKPVQLPVFLADAINTANPVDGTYEHSLLTEKGEINFSIPASLATSQDFFKVMDQLRVLIDAGISQSAVIIKSLESISESVVSFNQKQRNQFLTTVENLIALHNNHWNGIWCLILYDRISAGCVKDVDLVIGNPPWVKWSHLPRSYAEFIKPICDRMNIFSEDSWVGGIQSDISTVVTYRALERFVCKGGKLAFLITGTVFKNESSQGFRRWKLMHGENVEELEVVKVEDYINIRPFEGVANWPTLLIVRRNGKATTYPVPYKRFILDKNKDRTVYSSLPYENLLAIPVPNTEAGPWLVGTKSQLSVWPRLFAKNESSVYRARKGVTTDANGIFFVSVKPAKVSGLIQIENNPKNGRRMDIIQSNALVETDYIFPLLRGRDVKRFSAKPVINQCVIVPQKGMHGDESLPVTQPKLFKFLSKYREILEVRSSYLRFQKGKAFWSIWSTGEYTFSKYKVVWKEMSGSRFVAAYIDESDFNNSSKIIIPDHKVYFVPLDNENEAAYLTAFLNSRLVAEAINAYSAALSLGTSVTDYLNIPKFDENNSTMMELATMAKKFTEGVIPTSADEIMLDTLVKKLIAA